MKTIKRHWKRMVLWGGVGAIYLLPLTSLPIFSAFDAFYKIDTIPGESTDPNHQDWIDIDSFSFEVTVPISGGGGGARSAGNPSVSEVTVVKSIDKSSPQLFFEAVSGNVFTEMHIEVTRDIPGAGPVTYYKITMEKVFVSSVGVSGDTDDPVPTENVTLNYGKIKVKYTEYDGAGNPKGSTEHGYDVDNQTPF